MNSKTAIGLIGVGSALLVGSVMDSIEAWVLHYRSDGYWVSGLGAGLLASGWALLMHERPRHPE